MRIRKLVRVLLILSSLAATVGITVILPIFFPFVAGFKYVPPSENAIQIALSMILTFPLMSVLVLTYNSLEDFYVTHVRGFSFRKPQYLAPVWATQSSNSTVSLIGISQG